MAFRPYSFAGTEPSTPRDSAPIVHIAEGEYLLEIVSCAPSPENAPDDKDPYHQWALRTVEGPGGGGHTLAYFAGMVPPVEGGSKGTLWRTDDMIYSAVAALDETKARALQAWLRTLQVSTWATHKQLAEKLGSALAGKQVWGLVIDRNRDGKLSSIVDRVRPPSAYGKGPAPTPVNVNPALVESGAAPAANDTKVTEDFMAAADALFASTNTL